MASCLSMRPSLATGLHPASILQLNGVNAITGPSGYSTGCRHVTGIAITASDDIEVRPCAKSVAPTPSHGGVWTGWSQKITLWEMMCVFVAVLGGTPDNSTSFDRVVNCNKSDPHMLVFLTAKLSTFALRN